jgi:flagellar motor switch protein FliN/FliY
MTKPIRAYPDREETKMPEEQDTSKVAVEEEVNAQEAVQEEEAAEKAEETAAPEESAQPEEPAPEESPQQEDPAPAQDQEQEEDAPPSSERVSVEEASFETFSKQESAPAERGNLNLLKDVPISVMALLGKTEILIDKALKLVPGSIIELDRFVGEPLDLLINNKRIAQGEVVVVGEHYGIRITKIIEPEERIQSVK